MQFGNISRTLDGLEVGEVVACSPPSKRERWSKFGRRGAHSGNFTRAAFGRLVQSTVSPHEISFGSRIN